MSDSSTSLATGSSTSLGAGTVWYRSLYWRIAVGLVAFLALMLGAQGALFIYTTDRIAGSMPATSPRRLAVLVASDLSAALNTDPTLDIDDYVQDQYSRVFQPFIVLIFTHSMSSLIFSDIDFFLIQFNAKRELGKIVII